MNNLRINLTTADLAGLTPSGGTYSFIIDFRKLDGTPLNNGNIPNSFTVSASPTGQTFALNVPITNGNYTIPNVMIVIFNFSRENCCFVQTNYTIINSTDTEPVLDGVMMGNRISTKGGKTLYTHGSQDMEFVQLETGNVKLNTLMSRLSFNNTQTVNALFFGNYMQKPCTDAQMAALLSPSGLNVPSGYHIALTLFNYFTAPSMGTTVDGVANNLWTAMFLFTVNNPLINGNYNIRAEWLKKN